MGQKFRNDEVGQKFRTDDEEEKFRNDDALPSALRVKRERKI